MEKSKYRYSILLALSVFALSACNGSEQKQVVDGDWISDVPAPTETPAPNPDASPTPTPPASTPSDLYTGPAEMEKYVVKFVEDALIQGVDVTAYMAKPKLEIRIASLDSWGSSTIGLCETGTNLRRVTFDPDFWNTVSETQRELVAHHELGHCVLYRAHRSDLLSTGKYASIMYPTIMSSATYTGNYDYYQEELFTYKTLGLETPNAGNEPTVHVCQ